jgi:MFS family permease
MSDAVSATGQAYPPPLRAWTLVVLLTLAYVLSYLDRSILGALVQPIKADLGVSDEQMGYLSGIAFGIFYAAVGVPLGWLADRASRTRIVAGGIALWSAATVASGFARGFGQLFAARMMVGVGEAALSPCAMSLIADSFPPEKRGKPVGLYSTALALAVGLSGLIGAYVLSVARDGIALPLVGTVKAWQFAFIAVGLPGLFFAFAFLLLPEPARRTTEAAPKTFGAAFGEVRRNLGALGGVTLLASVMTTIAFSQFFNVAAFSRTFGWTAQEYLRISGTVNLLAGPVVVFGVGYLIDTLRRRGMRDAAFRILTIAFVPMIPLSAMALFMPNGTLAMTMVILAAVCVGAITSSAILALLDITPGAIRGQVVALYYMTISIAGNGLGPTTVGILSTQVFGEANLRYAIATVPVVYGLVPLLLLPVIARAYRRRLAEVPA